MTIPPIQRSITVPWDQEKAFRRFTADFAKWWPHRTFSIGTDRVQRIVFEAQAEGRIYEELRDGRCFQWGQILEWEPPRRLKFTWHPSQEASVAQEVAIEFTEQADGTRVDLVVTCWEKLGKPAHRARKGAGMGWNYMLQVYAGRKTGGMALLDGIVRFIQWIQRVRGKQEAEISSARGRMPRV